VLVLAEEFAQVALAAVAHDSRTDRARRRNSEPGRGGIAAGAHPEQEPAPVDSPAGFARGAKIGAAPHALRRPEAEAALQSVRQR